MSQRDAWLEEVNEKYAHGMKIKVKNIKAKINKIRIVAARCVVGRGQRSRYENNNKNESENENKNKNTHTVKVALSDPDFAILTV